MLLHEFCSRIASIRKNPSPHVVQPLSTSPAALEAEPLLTELDALAGCYRQALAEVIQARGELEEVESANGPLPSRASGAPDRNPGALTTHYVIASSRHRMVARLAPNLHWVAATPPLQQLLGRSVNDLIARPFLETVHPSDAPFLRQTLREALKDGEAHNVTFRILAPDRGPPAATPGLPLTAVKSLDSPSHYRNGGPALQAPTTPAAEGLPQLAGAAPRRATEATAFPGLRERHLQMDVMTCYTEAGDPLHLRCHFIDVTDRVVTENALRRRTDELSQANTRLHQANEDLNRLKESYRDLYHQAPVLYFSLDAAGHFVACNFTMLRTLGYPREELLGQPYTSLLPPEAQATFLADPTVFQRPGELETQWLKHDGAVIDVWVGTTTIRDEQGGFVRSRSAARDVTEHKRLANALQAKAAEVAEVNAHLRRVNQELEDFTYVVSHDLKEPLRTLEAFSNFLAQDYGSVLAEEGNEYISHLIQASRRLGALIDDLLTLSRSGRVIHTPRPFSWNTTVQTVLGDLRDLIDRKQAIVRVENPLPPAVGDPERVMQLLANLFANGLKYNKSHRPEVVFGAAPTGDSESPLATFYVRDNGIGIEPGYHDQIFRMFRRLHRRDEVEGTGAGLAICKRIVEAHGGRIWLESEPGCGTTFYFTLPTNADPPPARLAPLAEVAVGA
jgi:PAS domain S-box-containing protein